MFCGNTSYGLKSNLQRSGVLNPFAIANILSLMVWRDCPTISAASGPVFDPNNLNQAQKNDLITYCSQKRKIGLMLDTNKHATRTENTPFKIPVRFVGIKMVSNSCLFQGQYLVFFG